MKAIFEFDLPDENNEFKMKCNATDMYISLYNIDTYLREIRKGWTSIKDNEEEVLSRLTDYIIDSKIHEIE